MRQTSRPRKTRPGVSGNMSRSATMYNDDTRHDTEHRELIERYNANERTNHWITAISFVLLALSGLAMFHPAMFWLSALFGGGQWTRILHPFIGLVMFVSFLILAVRFWHHNYLDRNDWQWMRQIDDVLANREA